MADRLIAFMKRFISEIDTGNPLLVAGRLIDFYGLLYTGILSIVGLIWLIIEADLQILIDSWAVCIFIVGAAFFFRRNGFFMRFRLTDEHTGDIGGSLLYVVTASAVWIFGPTALLLTVATTLMIRLHGIIIIRRFSQRVSMIWLNYGRNSATEVALYTFFALVSLQVYEWAGGTYPINSFDLGEMMLPLGFGVFWAGSNLLAFLPIYTTLTLYSELQHNTHRNMRYGIMLRTILPAIADAIMIAFGVLAAALYFVGGEEFYVFNILGFMLAAYVSHQLSQAVERNRRRSVEAERLEHISQLLLDSAPDGSELANIIDDNGSTLYGDSRLEIRLFPDNVLLHNDTDMEWGVPTAAWDWIREHGKPTAVKPKVVPEWALEDKPSMTGTVLVPIRDRVRNGVIGGIYVDIMVEMVDIEPAQVLQTTQALARQIESVLHSAHVYRETLELQKAAQELEIAGKIQSSFLPSTIPEISGWNLAATIHPARQTSGDFYDFVPLDNGNIGILVADVADKGTGAALYMALSRTLIRTYAMQFPDNPEEALAASNERILSDTKSDQFVTVFYAILKPDSGELIYANAGHNPAILVCKNGETEILTKTGIPLGMFKGLKWKQSAIQLSQGDILVLYTDGASEAQNDADDEFGEDRLVEIATEHLGDAADDVQEAIMEGIHEFVGDAPQFDDITLMVAVRQ